MVVHERTWPYRPQTDGKIERFHRTLGEGWTYAALEGTFLDGCIFSGRAAGRTIARA